MAKKNAATIKVVLTDGGTAKLLSTNINKATHSVNKLAFASSDLVDRELKGVAEASSNSTKEFSKMSQGIGGLVHTYAIFAANIFAVSAAFRALSEAADFERMITASEQLSVHTGKNLISIAQGMKSVSAGALDMQAAMQGANLGAAAGFTGAQLKKLTKLATQAGIALGRSVPDSINRLTTAVVKGEPELTDELGIILRLKEATEDYAKAHGKAVKDLTTGERLQAVYEQAIERGEPKYGEINVESQSFDKLAANLKDISKELLSIVNTVVGPLASGLAESKGIIIVIIALLAKMLLTKSTESFGAGLNERLYNTQEQIKKTNIETDKLVSKLSSLDEIKLDAQDYGIDLRKQASFDSLNESLEEGIRNSIQDGIKGAKISKIKTEKLAQSFMKSFSPTIRRQLPELIKQGVSQGAKSIQIPDISGKLQTFKFDDTKGLETLGKNIEDLNQVEEAARRTASSVGRLGIKVEKTELAYKKWSNTLKSARLGGFSAGLAQGLSLYREGLDKVKTDISKATLLTRKWALATYKVSFAVAKVGKFLNGVVSVVSKITVVLSVLSIVWTAFSKLFNIDTGNLTSAREKIEDITDNLKLADKAAASIQLDVDNLKEYKALLTKVINIGTQYVDIISELGVAMDDMAKGSWFEKLRDGGETSENVSKLLVKTWGKFYTLMNKTPEGAEALSEVIDKLNNKSLTLTKHVEVVSVRLAELYSTNTKDTALLGKLGEGAAMEKVIKKRIEMRNIEIGLIQKAANSGTKAADIEFKLIKERLNIHKKITEGDQEGARILLERIQRLAEALGIEDSMYQISQQLGIEMQNGVLVLTQWTAELQNMSTILDGIMKQFANFAGAKNALNISTLEEGISINAKELSKEKDADKRKEYANDIIFARQQINRHKTIGEVDRKIAAQNFKQKTRYVEEISQKETFSLKDKKRALDTNRTNELNNAKELAKIQSSVAGAQREVDKFSAAGDTEKRKAAQGQLNAAEARLSIVEKERDIIKDNRIKLQGEDVRKKAKKSGGSKSAKVTKVEGREAQIALEKLKQIQTIYSAIQKAEGSSMKERYEASKQLYAMELAMHELRLGVIEGNKKDAQTNINAAAAKGDNEKLLQAQLAMQKAITAEVAERAGHYDRIYQLAKANHEAQKKMFNEDFPDLKTFSVTLYKDIQYAAKELRDALMDPVSLLTEALVDVFKTGADSIADAIVENDWSSVNENIAESLKGSAKKMISSGIQGIVSSFIPIGHLGAGSDTDQLSAQNTTNEILNDMLILQQKQDITGMFGSGNSGGSSFGFIEQGIYALLNLFKFEKGGIIDHLGIGQYASGHIATRPELAMIGEGKNNEAVIPMPDNKSVPVTLSGNSGAVNSNVYVSIASDGTSTTSTESDAQEAKRLGELINKSVQRIIVNELRVGGLLGA